MAKPERNTETPQATDTPVSAPAPGTFSVVFDKDEQTEGLGSRGNRKGREGSMSFRWSRIPHRIIVMLASEGASNELYTASTAAERALQKLKDEAADETKSAEYRAAKLKEAADYEANFETHALGFMEARVAQWQLGNFGRTRGMTDPVEVRVGKIATDRFLALVGAGKVKGIPPNARLTQEQKDQGRDKYLAVPGKADEIRKLVREQMQEEARRAKEAAQVSGDADIEVDFSV